MVLWSKKHFNYVCTVWITLIVSFLLFFPFDTVYACRCTRTAKMVINAHPDYIIEVGAMADRIGRRISTSCFVVGPIWPEYALELEVEVFEEEDGRMIPGFADELSDSKYFPGDQARAVIPDKSGPFFSRATLVLLYTGGESPDDGVEIKRWRSFAETQDINEHEDLLVAEVKAGLPLQELAWDYEAEGESFEIELGETCVEPNSDVEISRKNIHDWRGRPCGAVRVSDKTRYLIQFEDDNEGYLPLTDKTQDGSYAIIHSECDRVYKYRTPDNEEWNEIPVQAFRSCDVLKESVKPMSDTSKKKEVSKAIIRNRMKLPAKCSIKPSREALMAGKTGTITIKRIVDEKGERVQPYDRLFVKADNGKILNGVALAGMKAFDVGSQGKITLKYQAPADCTKVMDTIVVYGSCSTSEKPAEAPGNEIAREPVALTCGYGATVTGRYKLTRKTKYEFTWPSGSKDQRITNDIEEMSGSIRMTLTPAGTSVEKDVGTISRNFKVEDCSLVNFSGSGQQKMDEHHTDNDRDCSWEVHKLEVSRNDNPQAVCEGTLGVIYDIETGRAKYVSLPVTGISYEASLDIKSEKSGCGSSDSDESTLPFGKRTFSIGPTTAPKGEDIASTAAPEIAQIKEMAMELQSLSKNPGSMNEKQMEAFVEQFEKKFDPDAIVKSMMPKLVSEDLKVKEGDGKKILSGGGIKNEQKKLENGFENTMHELKWRIYLQ